MDAQRNDPKPPPPAELSLKFMAWDIKGLVNAVKDLQSVTIAINVLSEEVKGLKKALEGSFPKGSIDDSSKSDGVPF